MASMAKSTRRNRDFDQGQVRRLTCLGYFTFSKGYGRMRLNEEAVVSLKSTDRPKTVFINLRKAYDLVDRDLLVTKMLKMGININLVRITAKLLPKRQ
jgi:hypothetical protein